MALSTHEGLMLAVAQENGSAVLIAALRSLATLIAAAPYSRLPQHLLLDVVQVGPVPQAMMMLHQSLQ